MEGVFEPMSASGQGVFSADVAGRPTPQDLVVMLVVGDRGLRSTLCARLSLLGADVVTAAALSHQLPERATAQLVLIIDAHEVDDHPALAAEVGRDSRWAHAILVGRPESRTRVPPPMIAVEAETAASQIIALFSRWRAMGGLH